MKLRQQFVPSIVSTSFVLFALLASVKGDELKPLEHEDYAKWRTIGSTSISNDGGWIFFTVQPGKGDAILHIRNNRSTKEFKVVRGRSARFSFDSKQLAYIVAPDPEVIKKLKKEKKPASSWPKSQLEILDLKSGDKQIINDVASFSMPAKAGGWIAFRKSDSTARAKEKESESAATEKFQVTPEGLERPSKSKTKKATSKPKKPAAPQKNAQPKNAQPENAQPKKASPKSPQKSPSSTQVSKSKKSESKKKKNNGTTLVLMDLNSGEQFRFPWVVNSRFSEKASFIAFSTSGPDGKDDGVSTFDLKFRKRILLVSGKGNYGIPVIDKKESQIAFLTDRDDYAHEKPAWAVYHWIAKQKSAVKIIDMKSEGMPNSWWIANRVAPLFTEDGSTIILQTAPIPADRNAKKKDDQEEKAKLDIWHWQDPYLQPQQLLMAERERNRSYLAKYDIATKKFLQIANREIPNVSVDPRSPSKFAVGVAPDRYNKMRSWDYPGYNDFYLIDLKNGQSVKFAEKSRGAPSLSPDGHYVTWWDGEKRKWYGLPTAAIMGTKIPKPVDLGLNIPFALYDELHDTPSIPGSYRSGGWTKGDRGILIYDRWDIWLVDPSGKTKPINLTGGYGRSNLVRLRRINLDSEARFVDPTQPMILSGLDHRTKASGFLNLEPQKKVTRLIWLEENVGGLRKAKNSNDVYFTRSTFRRFPDLWSSKLGGSKGQKDESTSGFESIQRISKANPQQRDYSWGTAELTRWKAKDGQELDGIVYKPDGFDPSKKYPMIVYFYERYSDRLHTHYPPAAGRSIINFSFYVSRGYVVFVPDIPYKVGEPGPSAANSVLPGVQHLISQGFIDAKRIGTQGHSWGGYQTAYLVTQTDIFACAESGAPVSNMTSAYGGIRWGSGMSRMFQYEKTQSRIGDTLWNAREKYIANSPLFAADKINTPLLILHNDKDTAVPWYQGIELFVALRRLEKPAWMLNYNDDPHWVMGDANRMDFAKRMQQFFDHYLQGDPMPEWMAKGIPAVDKGKKFGFEPAESNN